MIAASCSSCRRPLPFQNAVAAPSCPYCGQSTPIPGAPALDFLSASRPLVAGEPVNSDDTEYWPNSPTPGEAPAVPPATDPIREGFSLLAPPEGPDEIGRIGPYRVLKILGAGGMGIVFQAEDPLLKRPVALKIMLPSVAAQEVSRQRFLREAQATAAIDHEHIVTIYQVGEHRHVPYLVMQMLQGETLEARLRCGVMPLPEVLRIGREIAEGLAAAHERGLIHRDIKPANIWLQGTGGKVRILDFGLVRTVAEDSNLTQVGTLMGTPAYMAPEQARGQAVDGRTDLFSLGCILYRMCTGRRPFRGTDTISLLVALTTEEAPPIPQLNPAVPAPLVELVTWLLAKQPQARPANARVVIDMLAAMESGRAPGSAPRPMPVETLRPQADEWGDILGSGDFQPRLEKEEAASAAEEAPEELVELEWHAPDDWFESLAGRTLGSYEIGQLLGCGRHSAVFRARDLKWHRDTALKVLPPDFPRTEAEIQRFIATMKEAIPLRHPNLVSVYGAGRSEAYCWIAKEYVAGENLSEMIERVSTASKKSGWRRALRVAVHIARALEFAGQHQRTHRHLTPRHILYESSDRVAKLNDLRFGDAVAGSLMEQSRRQDALQADRPYRAPEQWDGAPGDQLSDLFSLGAVIHALLVGQPPTEGEAPEKTLKPLRTRQGLPSEFAWVVATMLAQRRPYRFQTPSELLQRLEHIAEEHDIAL